MEKLRLGVVLMQIGGPDSEEAIKPFLKNLLSDPDIIDFPLAKILRRPLARIISSVRARKVKSFYRMIGGKSPLIEITEAQASSLAKSLARDHTCRVVTAMRYWRPFTEEAVEELEAFSPQHVVLVPLYPQYCSATTGSSFNEWDRVAAKRKGFACEHRVSSFHVHPLYIKALAGQVGNELDSISPSIRERIHIIFSAHGLPSCLDKMGDPYRSQVEETVDELAKVLELGNSYSLAFQSRVGPTKWIRPYIEDEIKSLAMEKKEALLIVPVSFVSDHFETLYELRIQMKEIASNSGIKYFHVTKALNDSPDFIEALRNLVVEQLRKKQ